MKNHQPMNNYSILFIMTTLLAFKTTHFLITINPSTNSPKDRYPSNNHYNYPQSSLLTIPKTPISALQQPIHYFHGTKKIFGKLELLKIHSINIFQEILLILHSEQMISQRIFKRVLVMFCSVGKIILMQVCKCWGKIFVEGR